MLRDLWIGGVFGILLYGWRTQRQQQKGEVTQTHSELQHLRQRLAQVQQELETVSAQRTTLETQVAELNQLATDRAIELIQLQADYAELQAQVVALSQKRTRKKRVSPAPPDALDTPDTIPQESSLAPVPPHPDVVPFVLNLEAVQAKQQDAIAATELLQTVFAEVPGVASVASAVAGGLDAAHSTFLATLGQQPLWSRDELRQVAQHLNLLLDGALELINETAFDRCDEALTEGDDPLTVNPTVLQELLS